MELLIQNGDYVPDGKGGFRRALGSEELLQRALFKLTARRGSFPFLPQLGSELYRLTREKPSAWQSLARQYAAQALEGEELAVEEVQVAPRGHGAVVKILLEHQGEELTLEVAV